MPTPLPCSPAPLATSGDQEGQLHPPGPPHLLRPAWGPAHAPRGHSVAVEPEPEPIREHRLLPPCTKAVEGCPRSVLAHPRWHGQLSGTLGGAMQGWPSPFYQEGTRDSLRMAGVVSICGCPVRILSSHS